MSVSVKTCVVWIMLPTQWNRRCRTPEAMRRRFGPCTPQPFALRSNPGPMYLFCVAMCAKRATEIIEDAGAHICCQPSEGIDFDVTRYTAQHTIRTTNRETASGDEDYELILATERNPPKPKGLSRWWASTRTAQSCGPGERTPCMETDRTI
jgi:hypothetical protein